MVFRPFRPYLLAYRNQGRRAPLRFALAPGFHIPRLRREIRPLHWFRVRLNRLQLAGNRHKLSINGPAASNRISGSPGPVNRRALF
jgi:hypothetical protein